MHLRRLGDDAISLVEWASWSLALPLPILFVAVGALLVFLGLGGRLGSVVGQIPRENRKSAPWIGLAYAFAGAGFFALFRTTGSVPSRPAVTPVAMASPTPRPATPTASPTAVPATSTPPPATATPAPEDTVAISEVMFDACGEAEADQTDEYVELYNYGEGPVDLEGYWLTTGRPQRIVPWSVSNPFTPLWDVPREDQSSWVLGPKRFAVILTPDYDVGLRPYQGRIPPGTLILSVDLETGSRLGGPGGFVASTDRIEIRSVLILYLGSESQIVQTVSSYGSPAETTDPTQVHDDGQDSVPLLQPDCRAAHRIDLAGLDQEANWKLVEEGSPGLP